MEKIFEKACDQHVVATKVYVKESDAYAYSDSAKTKKIKADALKEMFLKGMVIVDGDETYVPVGFSISGTVGTVTYVTADGTTATTAVLATLASEEYTA